MDHDTTARTCRDKPTLTAARELARGLTAARAHVASGFYRSCRDCHELFAPVFADERLCPACAELRKAVARGPVPLPQGGD